MTKKKTQDEKRPAVTPVKGRLLVFLACLEEKQEMQKSWVIFGAQASVDFLAISAK